MKTIIILVVSIGLVGWGLGSYLAPDDISSCGGKPGSTTKCLAADTIVAISGGDTTARTKEAIKLYQDGWAPRIIFSGAAEDKTGPSNAQVMADLAVSEGVPPRDIITEDLSETTEQNAAKTQQVFAQYDVRSVIVVTSPYHLRRAKIEFTHDSKGIAVRVHPASNDSGWSNWWWLTPTGWYLALGELVKISIFSTGSPTRNQ
jgi:uncharacterized SAM-binding protein YcdF (DUF218 family)